MNFFDDPSGLEELRDTGLPPGTLPPNPLLNDAPDPHPDDEIPEEAPKVPSWKSPAVEAEEAEGEEAREASPSETPSPPQPQPQPQSAGLDYGALAQAMAWAMSNSQPRPQPKPEDFDPPELELPLDEDFLEGRASIRKELRRVQVETARHLHRQYAEAITPVYQELEAHRSYVSSRAPVDEANARSAARSYLVRSGMAQEAEVDELLDRTAPLIRERWDYRTNPNGWVAGAHYELTRSGSLPVKRPTKPLAGAGRGDAPTGPGKGKAKPGSVARKNPHIRAAEQLLGKPLSEDRLASWEEKFA